MKSGSLINLTLQLTRARFSARQGETLLYFAAIVAFTFGGALSLTVAAGTWMFYQRHQHPTGLLAEAIAQDSSFQVVTMFYFVLALVACALLIPATVSLARAAAVLGARGRERRLATLRLIGLTSSEVTRMSLVDTAIQAIIGLTIGTAIYLATFSLWQNMSFQGMVLSPSEMLLPWWLGLAVLAGVLGIGIMSSWWALRQVRVSPLGISRNASRPGIKVWQLVFALVLIAIAGVVMQITSFSSSITPWLVFAGAMIMMIFAFDRGGPYLLQLGARITAHLPSPTIMWASRRIAADARATWNRISNIGILTFVAGFFTLMPITFDATQSGAIQTFGEATKFDLTKGATLTLCIGLVLGSISILISQASAVFERAEQTVAMQRMGAPLSFQTRVMWVEVLAPIMLAMLTGFGLGIFSGLPMYQLAQKFGVDLPVAPVWALAAALVIGLGLGAAALLTCSPLQRRVLADQRRKND